MPETHLRNDSNLNPSAKRARIATRDYYFTWGQTFYFSRSERLPLSQMPFVMSAGEIPARIQSIFLKGYWTSAGRKGLPSTQRLLQGPLSRKVETLQRRPAVLLHFLIPANKSLSGVLQPPHLRKIIYNLMTPGESIMRVLKFKAVLPKFYIQKQSVCFVTLQSRQKLGANKCLGLTKFETNAVGHMSHQRTRVDVLGKKTFTSGNTNVTG